MVAIVGPSGAGKDTLMAEAKRLRPEISLLRRVITRPSAAGGEPFEGVTREEFLRRKDAGAFALWWEAHGLIYGIPAFGAGEGEITLFNTSRAMIGEAERRFPGLEVVLITAPDEILAARLAARGREDEADILARLARAATPPPPGAAVVMNDGDVAEGGKRLLAALGLDAKNGRDSASEGIVR